MSSSTDRFFDLPELAYSITGYLDTTDILSLVQTIRAINATRHPLPFRILNLKYDAQHVDLILCNGAIQDFSKSTHLVRMLGLTLSEFTYHYSCLVLIFDPHAEFNTSAQDKSRPYFASSSQTPSPTYTRLCWTQQMTPRSVRLTAHSASIMKIYDYTCLDGLAAGLSSLEDLDLGL
ncbi:hypothetical protein BGZ95_009114 [Linnemannia exigua]|uniref:F-box domain-containing protein n=1 Tax=Linnemannia exigua TaxID=604196 RepID=A0AAD4H601_9FUNG|nr:hypothetical protein BGZ95_009114 [Linnemannia exigua]